MTPEEQINHASRFRRFQQSREIHFSPRINYALHTQYKQFTSHVQHLGLESSLNKIDSGGIMHVVRNLYMDAGIVYGAKIRADFAKLGVYKKPQDNGQKNSLYTSKPFTDKGLSVTEIDTKNRRAMGFSEHMAQLIADYFRTDILNTSEGITDTTRQLIKEVFNKYYGLGYGIDQIVKELENTELSRVRARLIARTETVTAANKGALFVAKDTGLKLNKTWLATNDKRTRDDHRDVDGNQVGRDDYFNVGGNTMLHPGDRIQQNGLPVEAKEVVNCRCTHIYKAVRDAQGRLIRA